MLRGIINKITGRSFTQSSRILIAPPPASGSPVTQNNIETVAAIVRAITLISSDVARLPWEVVTRQEDGTVIRQSGPMEKMLREQPSQKLDSFNWRRHVVRTTMIYGNCICHIQKSSKDNILQLVPLNPDLVTMEFDDDGTAVYVVNRDYRLYPKDVLHFRNLGGIDGMWGNGLLWTGREALSLLKCQGETNAAIAGQGTAPRCVLKHPGRLSEQVAESVKSRWLAAYSRRNAGGVSLMMDGMSVETLDIKVGATDIVAALNYSIAEVSRLTGIPVSMLSLHEHSTFSNVQEMNRSYLDTCLSHWLAMIGAEIGSKILPTTRQIRWDTRELTKGTLHDQVTALGTAVANGMMTRNEARQSLGLNPIPGGDTIVMMPGMTQQQPDDEPGDDDFEV